MTLHITLLGEVGYRTSVCKRGTTYMIAQMRFCVNFIRSAVYVIECIEKYGSV